MPFTNADRYGFTEPSILAHAPAASGVYGVFSGLNAIRWIYVGESSNIRRRLMEHFREGGTCIQRQIPAGFTFERCRAHLRSARSRRLIRELNPICNQDCG